MDPYFLIRKLVRKLVSQCFPAADFCLYFATEYQTPPAVFITMPVKFSTPGCTPPNRTKPKPVAATPCIATTVTDVRVELADLSMQSIKPL